MMNIKESGIIIFMEHYESTVDFYITKLGLPVRLRNHDLTILDFGKSYLMIEDRGVASTTEKTRSQNPTVIRLDVVDFDKAVEELVARGVTVNVYKKDWGIIGVIIDPEGNRIEIKAEV
jgi:lactoylglutathione lyase